MPVAFRDLQLNAKYSFVKDPRRVVVLVGVNERKGVGRKGARGANEEDCKGAGDPAEGTTTHNNIERFNTLHAEPLGVKAVETMRYHRADLASHRADWPR
jgi:hypothetical protein